MKFYASLSAIALLVSVSSSALAATATPEEAARLAGVFQSYLGKEPGVVTVTPAGDAYDVKIDFMPFIKKMAKPDFSAEATPFLMKLADQGGGKWLVTQDQPISFSAKSPGKLDVTVKFGGLKGTGIFDQSLSAFTNSTTDVTDMLVDETVTTPEAGSMHIAYSMKAAHYETTAAAAGADAVDGTLHVTMTGLAETINSPASAATGMPLNLTITAEKGTQDGTLKGMKTQAIYQLVSWFVAHASEEAVKSNQAELKTLIGASLPVFENIATAGSLQNISVTTPIGPVGIASLGFDVGLNGIVADGLLHEGFKVDGLALPAGIVPPWAAGLVPQSFGVDFKVADFDLAAPAKIMLDTMDLSTNASPTPEENAKLLKALMPKGAVSISMGASKITSKLYDVDYEGAMTAGPVGTPVGEATIKAKGFDQVMDALKAAPPEMAGQAIPVLIAAKGMAKTEADGRMSWKIENTPLGGVLVNGIDVTKMGGAN
jgi:hypothetical protein